ncbi:MAG: MFS transporter, partial [Anaerolineaceae bacterium]|nr:MFS transporter [Anaerolineaceae bacterium]
MVIPPAFKSRSFLMYWIGHTVSFAGSQMQLWALYWHLRMLTDQPMYISGIGLVRFLPVFLLSLVAGVAADRFDRRKTTILTQLAQGLAAVALGFSAFRGQTSIWMLFALVCIQSVAVTFDVPARQALIPSLVPRENLASAYSLTSIGSKVGGILGPSISGLIIVYLGIEWAYWLNAISFLAVIVALIAMGNIQSVVEKRSITLSGTLLDMRAGIE